MIGFRYQKTTATDELQWLQTASFHAQIGWAFPNF
jgi:hypothetical protein